MSDGPIHAYRDYRAAGRLKHDPAQLLAVEKLQSLHAMVKNYQPNAKQGLLSLLHRRREIQTAPNGLYLYGGVGRGKSMLMDLFYESAPTTAKRRVHFHAFMQEVHGALHGWRQANQVRDGVSLPLGAGSSRGKGGDPLPHVAEQLMQGGWLLCFDEFHVNNIADAMILSRLFENLFSLGVVVVATSNWAPDDLYADGLQRERFLSFIELLKQKLEVMELASETDYRLRSMKSVRTYFVPNGADAEAMLHQALQRITGGEPGRPERVTIAANRTLDIERVANGVACLSFPVICGGSYGAGDYLVLAKRYHTILLSEIPRLSPENRNEARRLMLLIDALYEHRTNLLCSAAAPAHALYPAGEGATEFLRTTSRLIEMQSQDYHELAHISA